MWTTTHGRHLRAKCPFCRWGTPELSGCQECRCSSLLGGLAGMWPPWGAGFGEVSVGQQGLGLLPRLPGLSPLPAPAHFKWHYHVYMREHRALQPPLSQGNRELTSGHLGCLCSEAVDKAERAGRRRLLDSCGGLCRHGEEDSQIRNRAGGPAEGLLTRMSPELW